jgi:hypothetical protein
MVIDTVSKLLVLIGATLVVLFLPLLVFTAMTRKARPLFEVSVYVMLCGLTCIAFGLLFFLWRLFL